MKYIEYAYTGTTRECLPKKCCEDRNGSEKLVYNSMKLSIIASSYKCVEFFIGSIPRGGSVC